MLTKVNEFLENRRGFLLRNSRKLEIHLKNALPVEAY